MNDLELFEFILPDGTQRSLAIHQARSFGCKNMNQRCDEIVLDLKSKNKKQHKKDGFVPGWQENIRMHITCPAQYRRALKDLGLTEIGNERFVAKSAPEFNPFTPEVVQEAVSIGVDLSGNEIDALENGKYFED